MLQLGRSVPPRPIVAGEPLLTMRCVSSLEELAPWFSTLSLSLTRQQTRSLASSHTRPDTSRWVSQYTLYALPTVTVVCRSPVKTIEKIIEIDFMEDIPPQ